MVILLTLFGFVFIGLCEYWTTHPPKDWDKDPMVQQFLQEHATQAAKQKSRR